MLSTANIIKIVLILLQLADKLFSGLHDKGLIEEGHARAVAEANAKMLEKNQYAKEIMQRISSLDADATDKLLHELEPK